MKVLVGIFNQEKDLVGAFSVIVNFAFVLSSITHVALQRMLKGRVEHQQPSPARCWLVLVLA